VNPAAATERAEMETLFLSSEGESGRTRRGLRAEQRHRGTPGNMGDPEASSRWTGTEGEGNEAGGKGEGSLSLLIVPSESRETRPEGAGE